MGIVVITGAGRGMGRACVDALRDLGEIVAVDVAEPQIDGVRGVACDVTDPDAVARLADLVGQAGPLRALVHAAGISPTMGDARRVIDVDLVGTQRLLDAFEPQAGPQTAGVCLSSSAAYLMAPFFTPELEAMVVNPLADGFLDAAVELVSNDSSFAYGLAKVGVIRVVAKAAVRWALRGARLNSLAPGMIDTPMGQLEFANQPLMADMLTQTPLGRFGRAEEIAAVAAFMVSDAASFMTGIDILVDGGQLQGAKFSAGSADR